MSNESVIYNTSELICRLHIDGPMETTHTGPLYIFRILSGSDLATLKLEIDLESNDTGWFWWPNNEGERGLLSEIHTRLEDKETRNKGYSVIYPVSASCRTIIIGDSQGGIILSAMPDEKGRITRISAKAPFQNRIFFNIKSGRSCWFLTKFTGGPEDALNWLERIIQKVKWPLMEAPVHPGKSLLQVGLIGPDYDCMIPEEKGFLVLADIAAVMKQYLGKGNWLHVFGYAHGHDILYPDYTPSSFLGGEEKLKDAIRQVHRKGQKISFYMNIRMGDQNLVDNDFSLKNCVFKDAMGKSVIEKAHDRAFYIMDPNNQVWQDRLFQEAERLVELGADGLELSHLGEQTLMVSLGEQWGEGILKLMERIRTLGVKIWYRGGTDLYPADWLEIRPEEVILDPDGHIRSGYPLGEFDPRLYLTLVPGRSFLVPLSRIKSLPVLPADRIIRDMENIMGGLFIYDEEYLERIDMILKHAMEDHPTDEEEDLIPQVPVSGSES